MVRDLGTLGESTLLRWTADQGIAAQKVTFDRHGWDYLLEFPSPDIPSSLPLDKTPAQFKCYVQVKAISTSGRKPSASLANWQRFIMDPLPAFFLVLVFGDEDTPCLAYLIPVGKELSGKLLRYLRELDAGGESIGRRRRVIPFGEGEKLGMPYSRCLKDALLEHVGPNLESYVRAKLDNLEVIGYDSGRAEITFKTSNELLGGVDLPEALVDLALGLRGSLSVREVVVRDIRFGIPARSSTKVMESGELEALAGPKEKVEVALSHGLSAVLLRAVLYLPAGLSIDIWKARPKIRIGGEFFDIVIDAGRLEVKTKALRERGRLTDFHDVAALLLLINEASGSTVSDIDLRVYRGGELLTRGTLRGKWEAPREALQVMETIRDAWLVARHLEVAEDVEVNLSRLELQQKRLSVCRKLLSSSASEFKVVFSDDLSEFESVRVCVPIGTEVILGRHVGTIVVSLWGVLSCLGGDAGEGRYELISSEKRIEAAFASSLGDGGRRDLKSAVSAVVSRHTDHQCLVLPQYEQE